MSRLLSPVRGTGTSPSLPPLVINLSAPLHSSPRDSSQAWQVLWFLSPRLPPLPFLLSPPASFRGLETRRLTRVCRLPWPTLLQPTQPSEPGFLASTLLSTSAPRQPAHCFCCLKKRPHLLHSTSELSGPVAPTPSALLQLCSLLAPAMVEERPGVCQSPVPDCPFPTHEAPTVLLPLLPSCHWET